jgi:hypothetical protein
MASLSPSTTVLYYYCCTVVPEYNIRLARVFDNHLSHALERGLVRLLDSYVVVGLSSLVLCLRRMTFFCVLTPTP